MAHPLAGKPAPADMLINVPRLVSAYYVTRPDVNDPAQRVSFGTSGHRGSAANGSFNEDHILAVSKAICEYRTAQGIGGPLFLGFDTHALSEPAFATALEVFAAAGVAVRYQQGRGYTPTPAISHAILTHNRGRTSGLADGVVITPSHNPPQDGGFKYNPPHGGPAEGAVTAWIADRANEILTESLGAVGRMLFSKALKADGVIAHDFVRPYVADLTDVLDMDAIRGAGLKIGADPLGGASLAYWEPMRDIHGLDIEVVNPRVDPTFAFMPVDKDGVIRMDCSSPFAMTEMIRLKDQYDIAFGNDPDADRHGIVTRSSGLLNPNNYRSVAVNYLLTHRPDWPANASVGMTVVTSDMLGRVARDHGRTVTEVPVGFKWFVDGLHSGALVFGGEESAGASFLRKGGTAWSTDKDGILMNLLAAEITAVTGRDPGELFADLTARHGEPIYERLQAPANAAQKKALKAMTPDLVTATELAGEPITAVMTRAPGDDAPIGGLKVTAPSGWFAARPSGTEDIYKIYVESFNGPEHLERIKQEAQALVAAAFEAAGV